MARILGLDIGARSVKALLIESNLRGFAVRRFVEVKVDEQAGVAGALAELQAGKHLAADQIVVAVPGCAVATHQLTLPFTDARRIESTLGFEVEGQLPYDLSEVVYDSQVLSAHDGKSEVLVGAIRKDEVQKLLELLGQAGVDPRIITTSAIAYQNLLATVAPAAPASADEPAVDSCDAIVDIGHERTSVCIGRAKGGLDFARTFTGGGKELTRAVAAEFKVSFADAEAWKENEGEVGLAPGAPAEVERASAALMRGFAPLLRELRSTLRAHQARTRRPVKRVWLTGGTSRLRGLDRVLAEGLGVEVLKLDPIAAEHAAVVPEEVRPVAAQALALALRGYGALRAARFNLRKGDFAFKGDLDYLKGKVSRLAAFAAVLILLALVSVWAQFRALSQREAGLDKLLCNTTARVIGQCQKDYLVALTLLKGKDSPAASLPPVSALDLFNEMTRRLQTLEVKLEETEVNLNRVKLRGETTSFDAVDKVVAELSNFKCFHEIKRGKVQKNKEGTKVVFDLDIRVACPGQAEREEGA